MLKIKITDNDENDELSTVLSNKDAECILCNTTANELHTLFGGKKFKQKEAEEFVKTCLYNRYRFAFYKCAWNTFGNVEIKYKCLGVDKITPKLEDSELP